MLTIQRTREILGETGKNMTDEQISELVATLQNLVDYFMEKRETEIFGMPIKRLLAK